jgi:tRNA threonylcarbamoyl adenosine modification protein YjeE
MKGYLQYLGYKSVVFALQGEMGAGKTEMTKGIAEELKIESPIQSPTFIIEREYKIPTILDSYVDEKRPKLFHIDTWRLADPNELEQMDFVKQVSEGNVFVVEWADRILDLLTRVSEDCIIVWVKLEYGKTEFERTITVSNFL